MTETTSNNHKRQLYVLMGFPLLIVLLSTVVFFTGWGLPEGTSNKGTLINPPRLLGDYGIAFTAPESPVDKPVWTLLQIAANGCDAACDETLVYARQMRTSLGRRTPGLSRMLWSPNAADEQIRLTSEHEDLRVEDLPANTQLDALFADLEQRDQHQFYLIDPRGFVMMYYTPAQSYKEIIRDLKFLLTQSGY